MSSIGPQLPPHLTKRKRSPEDESPDSPSSKTSKPNNENEIALDDDESDSDDGYGPSAPKPTAKATAGPQHRPSIGPSLPPTAAADSDSQDVDDTRAAPPTAQQQQQQQQQQPRRIMGPAPPPADLSERPTTAPAPSSDSDSDSEDDYGPALPSTTHPRSLIGSSASAQPTPTPAAPGKPARDDWMLAPPEPTGYQERDPTKIKARKFASGAGATSRPSGGGGFSSIWTETPEQKAKRLADAVLGRGGGGGAADEQRQRQTQSQSQQTARASSSGKGGKKSAAASAGGGSSGGAVEGQQDKIRAFTEQTRGKSLVEQHQAAKKAGGSASGSSSSKKGGGKDDEEEDDPSKRAFDREKDMGLGMKITASQRKELLNRASDFGGRFQKGNYL
ncbi:hypothetical protein DHEL01_v201141 [Diaporthe helianthi]|uniref:DUF3752 domain-containing protein n=1 Tax=Diaporthe helianthi TaxID=158607 RepID=A0A2P5ID92_DIAHE|nr:hypothetical protein DHEL01_v201141 [Diaporthe helianthi]